MRLRFLAVLPVIWGIAFLVGDALFHGSALYDTFMRVHIELAKGMGLVGSLAAAFAFGKGEYLRRAWMIISVNMALLLLSDACLIPVGSMRFTGFPRTMVIIVANATMIVGVWLLARTWKVADLSLSGSKGGRAAIVAAMIVVALAVGGPVLLTSAHRLMQADMVVIRNIASTFGDIVTLSLVAPLLLTALALRGGLFGWPWALLTTSFIAWLFYDILTIPGLENMMGEHAVNTSAEFFRALACLYSFSAGMAQRTIVKQLQKLRPQD